MEKLTGVYIVKTHVWYVERLVWLVAGTDVVVSSILTAYVNPNWAFSILFVGMCSHMVAFTGFCIVGNILVLLGAQPLKHNAYKVPLFRGMIEEELMNISRS